VVRAVHAKRSNQGLVRHAILALLGEPAEGNKGQEHVKDGTVMQKPSLFRGQQPGCEKQ
jgi:hypothetical protein